MSLKKSMFFGLALSFLFVPAVVYAADPPSFVPPCLSGDRSADETCLTELRTNKGVGSGSGSSSQYTTEKQCRESVPCTLEVYENRDDRIQCLLNNCCKSGDSAADQTCAETVADSTQAYTDEKQCRDDNDYTVAKLGSVANAQKAVFGSCCTKGSDAVRNTCAAAVVATDPGAGGGSYTAEKQCRDDNDYTIAKLGSVADAESYVRKFCCLDGSDDERTACAVAVVATDPDAP